VAARDPGGNRIGGVVAGAPSLRHAPPDAVADADFIDTGVNNPIDTSVTYAVDASTGRILWSRPMPAPHMGGLTKGNDVIYHTLIDGRLVGLDAATGEVVFQDRMPGPAGGTVTVSKNRLFVGYGFNFVTVPVAPPFSAGIRSYELRR
jgi:outer membrane protein assembly factor BamB